VPRLRLLGSVTAVVAIVGLLGAAGIGFVLKSLPYQTPQLPPPRIKLTAHQAASFTGYPRHVRAVPVLAWRQVSAHAGRLAMTPARFAALLATLRQEGFRSVPPAALTALARGRQVRLPARPVALTFDGGLATDWTTVDPILRRYGFTATVFVNPFTVAHQSPSYFLTRAELRGMAASGRWGFGVQTPAAQHALRARSRLASMTGRPATAYAWPQSRTPTLSTVRAPAGSYPSLRRVYPAVFGRPGTSPAKYLADAPAAGPLPRIRVTGQDTLPVLAQRLRQAIPSPPPHNPVALPWEPGGRHCRLSGRSVTVVSRRFALCAPLADGSRWRDYTMRFTLTARPAVTALAEVRVSRAARAEVAIGHSGVTVKEFVGSRWRVLRQAPPPPRAGYRPYGPGRHHRVTIGLTGRDLRVEVGGAVVHRRLSRHVGAGVIALGLAGSPHRHTVTFRHLRLARPAP
jgi:hypothetical protein